ncbi:MAG: PspC domain-containing protein [Tissierellia bacterium]|nr:PspC domain-containing protein [Tissierellia bacterium]
MGRKLKRSNSNKMIAGVCGGIGEYFNIDPVIVRLIWASLFFIPHSPGFLLYLLCAIIIPRDDGVIDADEEKRFHFSSSNASTLIGWALVIVGASMLVKIIWPHLAFRFINLFRYWPALLIIGGFYIIYNQKNR